MADEALVLLQVFVRTAGLMLNRAAAAFRTTELGARLCSMPMCFLHHDVWHCHNSRCHDKLPGVARSLASSYNQAPAHRQKDSKEV